MREKACCERCGKIYVKTKSYQRFCTVNCRAQSWQRKTLFHEKRKLARKTARERRKLDKTSNRDLAMLAANNPSEETRRTAMRELIDREIRDRR